MYVDSIRKLIGMFLLSGLITIGLYKPFIDLVNIPNEIVLFENQKIELSTSQPRFGSIVAMKDNSVSVIKSMDQMNVSKITAKEEGVTTLKFDLAGFPIKKVNVHVLPELKVVPSGQSLAVKMNMESVLVVGFHFVETENGLELPGKDAGIIVGDIITKINGENVEEINNFTDIVQKLTEKREKLELEIIRENKVLKKEVKPLKSVIEGNYQLGLRIRNPSNGIGTLTFYHPESNKYGAIGHGIIDDDIKKTIPVYEGIISMSTVTNIKKGRNGVPGEKIATFLKPPNVLGEITKNSPFGIFGELYVDEEVDEIPKDALPVALANQVQKGPAKIFTVVEGKNVQEFDIEIVKTTPQGFPSTKGLVIKVTDPKLLETTGGIIQGMSGSPIIQNGQIVGAVSHVFTNDPTTGYGVHIEWMLQEIGIDIDNIAKRR